MRILLPIIVGLVRCQEDVQVSCDPDIMQIRITKGINIYISDESKKFIKINISELLPHPFG